MPVDEKEIGERLTKLRALRKEHGSRGVTLVPDLAFLALIDDLADAADATLELLKSAKPHRAYSLAKVALRASQRMLVVAADPDYTKIGVRTWLSTRLTAAGELPEGDSKTLQEWLKLTPAAKALADEQIAELKSKPWRTETFMWDNPAPDVTTAFLALGREQHVSFQLPPTGLKLDKEGMVTVAEKPRTAAEVAPIVLTALDIATRDATDSLKKRIVLLREEKARRLAAAAAVAAAKRKAGGLPEYKDDLGMYLQGLGVSNEEKPLPGTQVQTLTETFDDITVTAQVDIDNGSHSATLIFKGPLMEDLLKQVYLKFPDLQMPRVDGFFKVDLPEPMKLPVTATLGEIQDTNGISLVPLLVTKLD